MIAVLNSTAEYVSVSAFLLSLVGLLWQWSLRWTRIACSNAVIVPAPADTFFLVLTLTNKSSVSLSVHSAELVTNDMHLESIFFRDSSTLKRNDLPPLFSYLNSALPVVLPGNSSMRVSLKLVHCTKPAKPLPPLLADNQAKLPATLTLYTSRRRKVLRLNLSSAEYREWARGTTYSGGF